MNNGLMTTTLMDCMAAMPCAAGRRARAFITKDEKAKKTPPISPQPSVERSVKARSNLSIILNLRSSNSTQSQKSFEDVKGVRRRGTGSDAPHTVPLSTGEQGAENLLAPLAQRRRRRRLRRPRFRNGVRL